MPSKIRDFRPLDSRVLVEPDELNRKVLIPEKVVSPAGVKFGPTGTVIAVGPGRVLENGSFAPMGLSVGDRIYVQAWRGFEVKMSGKMYLCIDRGDILGVIDDAATQ